jgi:UDP-N-acetylmuramoylalanine-D-glutamate ligase
LDFFQNSIKELPAPNSHNYLPKIIAITGTNGKTTTTAYDGASFVAKQGKM